MGSGIAVFIVWIFITIGVILLVRLFGAWMLRINEVIEKLDGIGSLLKQIEKNTKPKE
jgi:hypothetical protein